MTADTPEGLASGWEAEARGPRSPLTADLELEGAQVRRVLAAQVRERLAPAWDALTAERDEARLELAHADAAIESLREQCSELAGMYGAAEATCKQLAAEIEQARARFGQVTDSAVVAMMVPVAERGELRAERDEAVARLATQHEAMTQLRADHSEALAGAESQVSAALKTVSRWQDENQRLIAERDGLGAACKELDARCEVHWLARQSAGSQLAEVRRIAYQGGQDAASVRRELLAYLEGIK